MSSDDDFPHLAEERAAYRRKVGFSIAGVLVAVTGVVLRISAHKDRERDLESTRRLNQALDDSRSALPVTRPTALPDHDPIELEVVFGTRHLDVTGDPIALGDGRTLDLVPADERTFLGSTFSFRHASSIRVTGRDSVVLTTNDATGQLGVVDSNAGDAADLAEMTAGYTDTLQVTDQTATRHTVLGKKIKGARLVAAGLVLELLSARIDKHRRFRAIITGSSAGADLEPLLAAVESVRLGKTKPTPEYTLIVRDAGGDEIERSDLAIGGHVAIGTPPLDLGLARLAMVRERLSGITFEHAPELSAMALSLALPAVQLRTGDEGIQIIESPMAVSTADLLSSAAAGAAITHQHPVDRSFAGTSYHGMAGDMAMGSLSLAIEVFQFDRGGRSFIATLQYPAGQPDTIVGLAGPVIASVE